MGSGKSERCDSGKSDTNGGEDASVLSLPQGCRRRLLIERLEVPHGVEEADAEDRHDDVDRVAALVAAEAVSEVRPRQHDSVEAAAVVAAMRRP